MGTRGWILYAEVQHKATPRADPRSRLQGLRSPERGAEHQLPHPSDDAVYFPLLRRRPCVAGALIREDTVFRSRSVDVRSIVFLLRSCFFWIRRI